MTLIFGLISLVMDALMLLVPPVPDFVEEAANAVSQVWGWIDGFETWIPVGFALGCVAAVGACYIAGLLIGLARVVASYLTLGGGAT